MSGECIEDLLKRGSLAGVLSDLELRLHFLEESEHSALRLIVLLQSEADEAYLLFSDLRLCNHLVEVFTDGANTILEHHRLDEELAVDLFTVLDHLKVIA